MAKSGNQQCVKRSRQRILEINLARRDSFFLFLFVQGQSPSANLAGCEARKNGNTRHVGNALYTARGAKSKGQRSDKGKNAADPWDGRFFAA